MRLFALAALVVAFVCLHGRLEAQAPRTADWRDRSVKLGDIHVLPVRDDERYGQVFMIVGAGGNVTAQMTGEGVILVDAGAADQSEKLLATLGQLTPKQVWAIINTSADPDHTGGNVKVAEAGSAVTRGMAANEPGAQVFSHENVLNRLSGAEVNAPAAAWPTDTYFGTMWTLPSFFYGDGIQMMHFPKAHTDGDTLVWFRHADVIATGDVFRTDAYPVIDIAKGGGVEGLLDSLNWVLDTAITRIRAEGGTLIVPGHGRLSDAADVAYYRDMVTIIRDRVKDLAGKGMTLPQIQAAKPTSDYDPIYRPSAETVSADAFVEGIYKSLPPAATTPVARPGTRRSTSASQR